jgi:RecA-family ATPase
VTEVKRTIVADPLALVQPTRARFAWDCRVPLGAPTLFAGTGGIGKSTILAWVISGLSRGSLPGDLEGTPVGVAIIAGEDDTETTLVPRLQAAQADMDRVWLLNGNATDGKDTWKEHPTIGGHLPQLKEKLTEVGVRVLIVDPVVSMQSGNSKDLSDVRRDLDKFGALAKELDLALIWVHHFNKGQGHASDRMSGSHAYRDIPRSVLLLAQDEDSGERILSHDKSNYGELQPSVAFSIETAEVPVADGEVSQVGRAQYLGESDLNVQDIVGREERSLGATRTAILELAESKGTHHPERRRRAPRYQSGKR